MVRDAILWSGQCQGGHGKPERCKIWLLLKAEFFHLHLFFLVTDGHPLFFIETIHTAPRRHERPNLFHADRHARLWHTQEVSHCCQWGEHTKHTHTRTHMHKQILGYFYRSYLIWKTRQRGDPCLRAESVSQHSTLTQGSFCFTPHGWEIWSNPTA